MSRIKPDDALCEVLHKMSEGNQGALLCLVTMINKTDWDSEIPAMVQILSLDKLELYGSNLYMVWNDCCNGDLKKLELVLTNWQVGKLTKEEIHANIIGGRGTPFVGLKTLKEILNGTEGAKT